MLLKSNHYEKYPYFRQCPAVITHSGDMIAQPQKCLDLNCNEHANGAWPSPASWPPIIRCEIDTWLAENMQIEILQINILEINFNHTYVWFLLSLLQSQYLDKNLYVSKNGRIKTKSIYLPFWVTVTTKHINARIQCQHSIFWCNQMFKMTKLNFIY